jgi:hypothetical protein
VERRDGKQELSIDTAGAALPQVGGQESDLIAKCINWVSAVISDRPPHTTWYAGPHQAVQPVL